MISIKKEQSQKISELEEQNFASYSRNVSRNVTEDSREWGEYVASQIIAYSQTDTEAEKQIQEPQRTSYEPAIADGYWTYSADPERALSRTGNL